MIEKKWLELIYKYQKEFDTYHDKFYIKLEKRYLRKKNELN